MKVLFVDEKSTWHKFFDLIFSLRNVEVLHAGTVREALNLVSSGKPDAAIVDVSISGASGYDLLPKLVELGVPVIFIGYRKEGFSEERALSLGASETLKRPFTVKELVNVLERIKEEELQPQELQLVLPEETGEKPVPAVSAEKENLEIAVESTAGEASVLPSEEKTVVERLTSKENVEEIIREIAWEVIPEMAEKIIREEVEKLIKSRLA